MAVTDEAVIKIRELIISGQLQPGDRLPQEAVLADTLGISRNSLREAVRVLEQMRVLTVRHGSGTYVSSLEPAQLLEGISFAVEMMRDDTLLEVLEVRQVIEPAATRLAVQRMTPEKLAPIREAHRRLSEATTVEERIHWDLDFHASIAKAADNDTLFSIHDGLSNRTVRLRIWGGVVNEDAVDLTIYHHATILKAIEAGDSHGAEAAALVHVTAARGWLDAYVSTHPAHPSHTPSKGRRAPVDV